MSFTGGDPVEVIEKDLERKRREGQVALAAAAVPFPGPAADAFSVVPEVPVGPYKVRPFYDIDWEFLKALDHPWYNAMAASLRAEESNVQFVPMGQPVWDLAYVFTTSPDEVEALFRQGGKDAVQAQSRALFSRLRLNALKALAEAVTYQQTIYWSAGNKTEDANAANPTSPPPRV